MRCQPSQVELSQRVLCKVPRTNNAGKHFQGERKMKFLIYFLLAIAIIGLSFLVLSIPISNAKAFCASNPPFQFLAKTGGDELFCGKNRFPPRIRQVDCDLFSCHWTRSYYQSDESYLKDMELFEELKVKEK